jgi:hypothetical protein
MQARNVEELREEPVQLVGISGRIGVSKGFDMGTEYTWDISKENSNAFATIWADGKVQITNRDNKLLQPVFSTGLAKGYVYDEEAKIHITSLPLMVSLPVTDRITPTFTYRYELLSDGFLPSSLEGPRHTFALGLDYGLTKPNNNKWNPKLAFSIGTMNSLMGGSEDSGLFTFNLGFKINSPYRSGSNNTKIKQ